MKIVMIPSTMLPFPPVKGGAVQNLIKSYVEWNEHNAKDELIVFSIYNKDAEEEALTWNYCKVVFFKLPACLFSLRDSSNSLGVKIAFKLIHYLYVRAIKEELKKPQYKDCQVVLDNTPQFLEGIYDSCVTNKKVIHIYNDYLNNDTANIEWILKNTDMVITVSNYISKQVLSTNLIDYNKVKTLYNGVDLSKFGNEITESKRESLRKHYGISDDSIVYIFVARLVPEKGIKQLIQAFSLINVEKAHLVIVGNKLYSGTVTDPFLLELQQLAMPCKDRIHFTGYIDYSELPAYYSMADVGVLPSLYEEPFALAAIEYMASGLAVILSDAGGFPEMADEEGALLVKRGSTMVDELKEAMCTFLYNKDILTKYQKRGKERSLRYSSQAYCEELNRLLGELNNE